MVTQEGIDACYLALIVATSEYAKAAERALNAKTVLDATRKLGLADGTIVGSNPDMREADARIKLSALYDEFEDSQVQERAARLGLDLARITVEHVKELLRLMEITAANG